MTAQITTRLERPYLPAIGGGTYAEIEVEPGLQSTPADRHVALAVDTSGSMSGQKIEQARDGGHWVFGMLEPDDYISIVSFDSSVEVVLEATKWSDLDVESARDYVDQLSAGGGTDIYSALDAAADELRNLPHDDNTARKILLLSDGKDNKRGPDDFEQQALQIDKSGIRITAAGIGDDYKEETIRRLGTTARGEWIHLDEEPNAIQDFFGTQLDKASTLVARDARLELDARSGVEVSEVYRKMPQVQEVDVDWKGNSASIKLPDLLERQRQKVVLRVQAPENEVGKEVTLLDVTLEASGEGAKDHIRVTYTDDQGQLAVRNEDVAIEHYETVARKHAGDGDVDQATTVLEEARKVASDETEVKVDNIEEEVTTVDSRKDQYETTRLEDDDGGLR